MPHNTLQIRAVQMTDEPALVALNQQLGYTLPPEQLASQLKDLNHRSEHHVLIAEYNGQLVGYIHGQMSHRLTSPPFLEICALVVDDRFRRKGIATQLVHQLSELEDPAVRMRVRHNSHREEAALFYQKMEFKRVKTQHVLDR
ncbi:MAG: GNAT family N-acetyltransferase [Saprospiraceae bacterium]|nr:GNAT family N-acetyltransferase [Saprospiraceae bacterium]